MSKELFRTHMDTFNRYWNGTSKVPEWFNVYNGAVRKLLELAPKVPE